MLKSDNMFHIIQDAIHRDFLNDNNLLRLFNRTYDLITQFTSRQTYVEYLAEQLTKLEGVNLHET